MTTMSKGVIAAMVAGALFGGLALGAVGTAGTIWLAGALERGRTPVYGRAAVGGQDAQAPGPRGMMGRGGAQGGLQGPRGMMGRGGAQGGLQGPRGMMGRGGAQGGLQDGPRYGDPDGAGPLVCPQCGESSTGTLVPPRLRR